MDKKYLFDLLYRHEFAELRRKVDGIQGEVNDMENIIAELIKY